MHGLLQFCALREKRLQIYVCPIMQSISGRIHEELLPTGYTSQFKPGQLIQFKKSKKVQADVQVGPHRRGMKRMPLMMLSCSKTPGLLGAVNQGAQAGEPPRSQSHTKVVGHRRQGQLILASHHCGCQVQGLQRGQVFHLVTPSTAIFIICYKPRPFHLYYRFPNFGGKRKKWEHNQEVMSFEYYDLCILHI